MSRTFVLSLVLCLTACGGAGRCTSSSECPVGASCDANLGVCVVGGSSKLTTGSVDAGSSTHAAANYAHACQGTANCADLPGTACQFSMCLNDCEGSAQCPGGTVCVEPDGRRVCGLSCTEGSCSGICASAKAVSGGDARVCSNGSGTSNSNATPSPIGGSCADDGDCAGSGQCVFTQSRPPFCGMDCTNPSANCGSGAVCVTVDSTSAACFAQCPAPGMQSTCRTGFHCVALTGKSYGACL